MNSSLTDTNLVDVTMPQMGVSVAEGTIIAWRVAVGDPIEAEQTPSRSRPTRSTPKCPRPSPERSPRSSSSPTDRRCRHGARADRHGGGLGSERAPRPTPRRRRLRLSPHQPPPGRRMTGATRPSFSGSPPNTESTSTRSPGPAAADACASRTCWRSSTTGTAEPPMHIESPYRPDPELPRKPRSDAEGLSRMRRTIGQRMKQSLDTAATCTTWIEVDMSRVEAPGRARRHRPRVRRPRDRADAARVSGAERWLNGDQYSRVTTSTSGSRCRSARTG